MMNQGINIGVAALALVGISVGVYVWKKQKRDQKRKALQAYQQQTRDWVEHIRKELKE